MRGHDLFRGAAVVAAVLCYTTILVGGTVMASDSGLGCPNWPTCFPNGSFVPAVHGAAQIEWAHRVVAFLLSVSVLALAALGMLFERQRKVLVRTALLSLALVVGEAALGGAVVRTDLAIVLVLVHLAIATALFALLLLLVFLSNLKAMPKRWIEWARKASEETPVAADGVVDAPVSRPEPSVAARAH
jgi:cytochrome c oxidase assembly protein subunit 15